MVSQYNTRRKSLSLPSLGIALPGRAVRSPPSDSPGQAAKRQKRSHSGSSSSSSSSSSMSRMPTLRFDEKSNLGRVPDSPPPSPGGEATKVDTQGIDDTIVVGVIEQLEKTGNRPHLLKELAMVLSPTIPIVESSANPAAIISSRLATYLKRNWSALSPCPLDKKLVGTHPKRVYYFLTTSAHQPIPDEASLPTSTAARIISPSLSSAASDDNDVHARTRSPSPELDLSDYDDAASDPFTKPPMPSHNINIAHNRRAQSPPLEKDEREFTLTASSLQERRRSAQAERERSTSSVPAPAAPVDASSDFFPELVIESEERAARMNEEAAIALFGHSPVDVDADMGAGNPLREANMSMSIEMPPPSTFANEVDDDWAMKSPENIELDELDDLFGNY